MHDSKKSPYSIWAVHAFQVVKRILGSGKKYAFWKYRVLAAILDDDNDDDDDGVEAEDDGVDTRGEVEHDDGEEGNEVKEEEGGEEGNEVKEEDGGEEGNAQSEDDDGGEEVNEQEVDVRKAGRKVYPVKINKWHVGACMFVNSMGQLCNVKGRVLGVSGSYAYYNAVQRNIKNEHPNRAEWEDNNVPR